MGAIADAVWAYAQPLLDDTDGSVEDMNWALSLSQLCWNLALLSKEKREQSIEEMRPMLLEAGADFEEFRTSVSFRQACNFFVDWRPGSLGRLRAVQTTRQPARRVWPCNSTASTRPEQRPLRRRVAAAR